MDQVNASILIDAPRERIFDFLQDIANHPAFTDHYLVDWRLTRMRSTGQGAGARFRIKAPGARFAWGDVSFVEVQPPMRIVEEGRMGKSNRIRTLGVYDLQPGPGGTTRVSFSFQSKPVMPSDRLADALGGRWWTQRMNRRALLRLRELMESSESSEQPSGGDRNGSVEALATSTRPTVERITVAGG